MIEVRALRGAALEAALGHVAALRIAVFRDWPYLYDGTLDYERAYLATYRDNPGAHAKHCADGRNPGNWPACIEPEMGEGGIAG